MAQTSSETLFSLFLVIFGSNQFNLVKVFCGENHSFHRGLCVDFMVPSDALLLGNEQTRQINFYENCGKIKRNEIQLLSSSHKKGVKANRIFLNFFLSFYVHMYLHVWKNAKINAFTFWERFRKKTQSN